MLPSDDSPLTSSASPFLRGQAGAAVRWHAWGEETFQLAARTDRPVLLSIGYAACRWSAQMHREAFADPATAALINERFVPVLVDRDERPDVDGLYVAALLEIQGAAGWPATLFLHPDLRPFTGATYLPAEPRWGLPSLLQVLETVDALWRGDRGEIEAAGHALRKALHTAAEPGELPSAERWTESVRALVGLHDAQFGGFGDGGKFPQVPENTALLTAAALGNEPASRAVRRNLDEMARRGLYDVLAGGFFRTTTDRAWSQPQFEKLLVDQAGLLQLYARASRVFDGGGRLATQAARRDVEVARDTARYVALELAHPEGGFVTGESADDPAGEGAAYRWTAEQARACVGGGPLPWGIPESGAPALPTLLGGAPPRPVREQMSEHRRQRPRPERVTTRVVSANGAAASALAEAGRLLGFSEWVAVAARTVDLLLKSRDEDGVLPRLLGEAPRGFLVDHAAVAEAALAVYQALPAEPRWLTAAVELVSVAMHRFRTSDGLFADSVAPELPAIRRPLVDEAEASGNARIAEALRQLGVYGADLPDALSPLLRAASPAMRELPAATASLHAVARAVGEQGPQAPAFLRISGPADHPVTIRMLRVWDRAWRPGGLVGLATGAPELAPFSALREAPPEAPVAWLTRGPAQVGPLETPAALAAALSDARLPPPAPR